MYFGRQAEYYLYVYSSSCFMCEFCNFSFLRVEDLDRRNIFAFDISAGTMTASVCIGDDCSLCPLTNAEEYFAAQDAWLIYDCFNTVGNRLVLSNSEAFAYLVACEVNVIPA